MEIEQFEIDLSKFTGYCLNPNHPEGKHKARLFKKVLGFELQDASELKQLILDSVSIEELKFQREDKFGKRYISDISVMVEGKSGTIRTVWILSHGTVALRLLTCFVIQDK